MEQLQRIRYNQIPSIKWKLLRSWFRLVIFTIKLIFILDTKIVRFRPNFGYLTSHSIISQFQSIIWFFDKVLKKFSQKVFKKLLHDCRPCPTAGLVAIHKSVCFIRYFSSLLCCRVRTVPAKKDLILLCQ